MSSTSSNISCIFPGSSRATNAAKRPLSVRVDLQQTRKLEQLLATNSGKEALRDILFTAWALLLRCYVGTDEVCFGVEEIGDQILEPSSAHLQVSDDARLGRLAENIRLQPQTDALDLSFNTSLLIRYALAPAGTGKTTGASMPENCTLRLLTKVLKNGISIFLEYRNAHIPTEQAKNVASTFDAVLSRVVGAPDAEVANLDYLSARNLSQIRKWNSAPLDKVERTIHDVIADNVRSSPDLEAVCSWDGSLTYLELDSHASKVASRLAELGIGPEVFVPLCFEKSKWNIVAMLAVLKAGGAFVPLDPAYPRERLQHLINSVEAKVLLCSRAHYERVSSLAETALVVDDEAVQSLPMKSLEARANGRNAAYIIPTSGTTGVPKLTLIEHGNYCTGVRAHAPGMLMDSTTPLRALQFAAHSFDASLVEILTPLMIGGTVCIPEEQERLNDIAKVINEMKVTWTCLTPTFVRFLEPSMVPSLATIALVGEAMSQANLDTWSKINLVNGYGPSECSVAAVTNPHVTPTTDAKNIGYAVGCHAWVVNPRDYNLLVPVGCVGELMAEGHTLARGYFNDEEKTSQAFVKNPRWSDDQDFRGYLTGDLVVQNSDGSLNFIGRKDTQVKYHGQRIELPEIEHHINTDAAVKHGLVLLPKSGYCKERLVAVTSLAVEPADGLREELSPLALFDGSQKAAADVEAEQIRKRISEKLPPYMVPSTWIVVSSIPLLASGKLDRKQVSQWLSAMDIDLYRRAMPTNNDSDVDEMPSTGIEGTLRAVIAHVLNLPEEQVGTSRSFLSLGGDSISAMQVMGQCQKHGMRLTVQEILKAKSIPELASSVKQIHFSSEERPEDIGKPFDLSPIQSLYYSLPNQGQGHFNQSFYLRVTRKVAMEEFRIAIESLVSRHSMLRARFALHGDVWEQTVTEDIVHSYSFNSRTVRTHEEIDNIIADSQQSLDAINGPLFAAELFDFRGEQHAFLVGHHLVIDLVSWRVLLGELEDILNGVSLLPPPLAFQHWCHLQAEHANTLKLDRVLPPASIPALDFSYWGISHEDNTYGNAAHSGFELDEGITSLFLNECHDALRTEPVEVLLASLIHSWSETFTDRDMPAFYNEGHGREPWDAAIDISRTVGWFTTVYPIYVQSSDSLVGTVRRVKDFRRRIPANGRPYFASRCLTSQGQEAFKTHWPWEISFNYLGQYQQLERSSALLQPLQSMAGETRGAGGTADVGRDAPRFGLFEVSAVIVKGRLRFAFSYNQHMHHQDRIQQWIANCEEKLQGMTHDLVQLSPEPTLSDYPLLTLTEDRFASMLQRLADIGVPHSNIEDIYPCSNMQEGLLLSQTKDAGFYAAVTVHEIKVPGGAPDQQKLADAWTTVVDRHAALRTIFLENVSSEDGLYDQVVIRTATPNIAYFDCEDEQEALRTLHEQRSVSYDDGRNPPHRFSICTLKSGRVIFSLEIAHTIMDGHSMSLMFRDLRQAYEGHLNVQGPLYSNYIEYLRDQDQDVSIDFWKSYLSGSEICTFPVLNDGSSEVRELRSIRLEAEDVSVKELQEFCSAHGITLSNVFHAAWALTLSCYVGSNDVTFGYLTSARDAPGIPGVEDMVGPLINTLVCRVNMSESAHTLIDILQAVQQDYMDSLPHRNTSLAEVQHTLGLSGSALFNTALSYRKLPPTNDAHTAGLSFLEMEPIYDPTEYPISLNIEVSEDAAMVDLDFWTDHVSDGQAANVASTFTHALKNILMHSDRKVQDIDHLNDRHRQQILGWNVMPETIDDCVHRRFAKFVKTQPDAPAICGFDGNFTYAELDSVAERLAHHLVDLGVGPEVFVPTCFDKSTYTVIAMLAVLKAGGACVPLDANHPKAALETRVEETQAQIVLSSPTRFEMFEDIVPDVVVVDSVLLDDLPEADGPACTTVQGCNPAFVIFTSGSTGRPKGVVLEHAAMVTSANAHGANLGVGPGTRFLQFASYTFDNSLEEMFTTLSRGGCVCVPSEEQRMNELANAIKDLGANFMDLTPTVASLLNPADVPGIKGMALGGEALTKSVVDQWSKHVHLHGQYGPSEASINSAWKDFKDGGEPTNIGHAIGSVSWIVDPENRDRLVPIGCKGELLIEGPILSRGYLNDPDKTAKAFIKGPAWAHTEGSEERRFYCTGDLVHYTSEGEMMYLGRKDSQVKLNGQRIELGEIEHHLKLTLPVDAQSAVELVVPAGGKKSLAAFLYVPETVADAASNPVEIAPMTDVARTLAKSIELSLSNALPAYYVPSMFIPVKAMPMTTSGKLDRKVLRQLAADIKEEELASFRLSGKSGRTPSGPVEVTLAKLWGAILKLPADSVGADDSFFRMGGDSIGAMRLVTSSRKEGIILTVGSIFSQPKLSEMAASATSISSEEQAAEEEPLQPFELIPEPSRRTAIDFAAAEIGIFPDSIEDIYPCTRLQAGLIALSTKEPGAYVAETIYRLPSGTDIGLFRQAWDRVAECEPILRTRIIYTEQHGFLQVVVREPITWHGISDLTKVNETDRHLPARVGGPLARYVIVGEGTTSPHFIWTAHHAIYDGWSLPLLLSKVEACYRKAQPTSLSSIPYARFIKYISSINEEESNKFWTSKFADLSAPQFPQLPSPNFQVQASTVLNHDITVSRKSGADITMASMIRAAWALIVATYSGSDDVLWGETNSGREVPVAGVEDILGPTITTAPMRMTLDRQLTVQDYLHDVQKQSTAALPFQFAGIQHIKKLSSDTAAACEFQNLLAVTAGEGMEDPQGGLWDLQSTGTIGTNFFTYPLIVNCAVVKAGVEVECHYDAKVIPTWLVQRLLQQFDFILQRFNSPQYLQEKLAEFELVNPADEAVVSKWNNRPITTVNKCVHNVVFQEQAVLRPDAIAVDAWDTGSLSYRQLDERASRLASKLISMGVKPKTFVPLCFDKSGWIVVAMLAVLKTGAAFVPLDFEAPLLRIREIVSDVQAKLILCSPQYQELCHSIPVTPVPVDRAATEKQPGRLYSLPYVQSDTPAYVIFTSGSTGKPKGAVIHHCSFVSNALEFGPALGITSNSRVLQFASYAFDASLIEILCTLLVGGTICIPDQASRTNNLPGVINDLRVTWAAITPSVVRTIQPGQVPNLEQLVLVGEAMTPHDLSTWADKLTLMNAYGPTETSIVATVNPMMTASTHPANLGRAVGGRSWIVSKDNHHALVPVGAVGELVMEGSSVGAGYLNNPVKTAEAFVTNLRWAAQSAGSQGSKSRRFYKTGDLVKYNEDGTMIFLGRKDFQTKVRGQRLELSEVEHHLVQDPSVQNAFAAVPTAGPCSKRLIGVVSLQEVAVSQSNMTNGMNSSRNPLQIIPTEAASFNINGIRDRLCEKLPSYMVPSLWIAIEDFPLLPSGKMDRRRVTQWLDKMDDSTYQQISAVEAEATTNGVNEVESKLQAIFGNVLNLPPEQIRLNQSFLHLGGDSISAMQVSSQCRTKGLGAISVQDVIRSKSISELATKAAGPQDTSATSAKAKDFDLPFDLTPIQDLFFQTVGKNFNHFNQSVVLKLSRRFEAEEIESAVQSLASTHSMLRARFAKDDSECWRQRIDKDAKQSCRVGFHTVSDSDESSIRPVVDGSQASLDIINGPLFAVDVFDIEESYSQAISLVAHHLIIDVVSWGIVLEDLQSLLNGDAPAPQSLAFHTWSQVQAEQAHQETARRVYPLSNVPPAELDYWGMADTPNVNGDVITEDFELSPKDSMLLLGAQDALATEPLDVFIAAALESFRKVFSDRTTAAIHNEGHGRQPFDAKQDLSRTIGWFTTLTPVHLPVAADEPTDIVSTIRWVKDLRERVPDKGRPYFAYRRLTQEGRDRFATHWPAEITFNYLGRLQQLEKKDALLQHMQGISTSDIGSNVPRFALVEITAVVAQGSIKLSFSYNRHMKRQPEIKQWVSECRTVLVDAVDQLLQLRPEPTLTDFKLLPLTYNGLAKLSAALPSDVKVDSIEDIYPTSPMQEGILLSQMKDPEQYAYYAIFEIRSTDPKRMVDARRIAEAWQTVVQRHPALRTVFIESLSKQGVKDQVVLKEKPARISWITDANDDNVPRILEEQKTVDYRDVQPPHRLTLCKTTSGRLWVKMEISHAISDGGSVPNLLRDLSRAYEGKLSRSDSGPLFSSFIGHLQSSSRDADINYWKSYLSGIEPCNFPVLNDGKPGLRELTSRELHLKNPAAFHAFCRKNGVTLSNVLQLGWALILHCYVGQADVSFGVVASGRDIPVHRIEEAVGCFVNMLICRIQLGEDVRISQILSQLQTDSVNAMAHQHCALADVQHELQLPSLFNTVFTFQRRQLSRDPETTALMFDNVEAADPGEYSLTVNTDVTEDGITVDFGFWEDKLCVAQAENMIEAFEHALTSIVTSDNENLTVGELDFFTPGSLRQVRGWNEDLPSPVRRCIHDMISEQALTRPSTPAIRGWDGDFTYQEFDQVTTSLAGYLSTLGVTTETFVPILTDKSSWAMVSMIAIMKAGAAYVPLDPAHPPTRLQQLVTDVGANVVLCSPQYHARAAEIAKTAVVVDRKSIQRLSQTYRTKPKTNVTPENAAYCLFTSGTTGMPKGTVIQHYAFNTSARDFMRLMYMEPSSRVFQFASYTFDASCAELLAPLTIGACVCVPSPDDRMNDPAGAIRKMKVSWSFLTPSVASTIKPEKVPTLKTLVTGGEAMNAPLVAKWGPKTCLVNGYGPTETSVFAVVGTKTTPTGEIVNTDHGTIGLASGARCWIVHPRNHDKLMPIGSVGELVIEGHSCARGYLNNKEKTDQVFIQDPAWVTELSNDTKLDKIQRMYKSGDLVRYNSDGSIRYIGRKDTQIKLNGQRIELGEIEFHVKAKFPPYIDSAVELVAPAMRNASKALAVFFSFIDDKVRPDTQAIQPVSTEMPAADEIILPMDDSARAISKTLENDLAGVLPSYMIPSIFIPVTKMPWTSAGKLDRNRLRSMIQNLTKESLAPYRLANAVNKRKPVSKTEQKLQKLVCSVLNLEPSSVGTDDSFFRLGGDSVLAMRLVAAAEAEHLQLSVIDIFTCPKLADLAAKCGTADELDASKAALASFQLLPQATSTTVIIDELAEQCRMPRDKIQDAYPASPLQEAFVTLSMKQPGAYVAQHVLELSSSLDLPKFQAAWQRALQEIELLRTRIVQLRSGEFLQVVLSDERINWEEATRLEDTFQDTIHLPSHNGGSLATYAIVKSSRSSPSYFVWTLHHALYDAWCMPIVLQRVEEIYKTGASDIPMVPYSRFIKFLLDTKPSASSDFWRSNLAGASPLQFPQRPHSNMEVVPDGQELTHIAHLAPHRHSDITASNVIRAAWALLLAAYTGSDDVVFGETLTGRDIAVPGITDVVGPTLTTVPTRVQINRGMTVLELLHGISRGVTDRIPYQHAGLTEIKRMDSDAAAACDFQNLLSIQTGGRQPSESFWKFHNNGIQTNYFTYPLVLECRADNLTIEITAYYDRNVVSEWQAQRILYQLDSILGQLNSIKDVRDIKVLSEQDLELVKGWNSREPVVVDDTIQSLFLGQASSRPSATAVSSFDGEFTYSELRDHASRLAQNLIKLGVGAEKLVPLCMDKSRWAIVAIMGVLMAGGGYVPLSPEHPASRHQQIIKDCNASVLLCSPAYESRFSSVIGNVISIDEAFIRRLPASRSNLAARSRGQNICYVLYTSGSTGLPKGVVIEHRAIASSSFAIHKALHMKPTSRVFQFGSFVFDASVMEILTTLTCGATICIPSEDERTRDIASAINRLRATWTCLTPSVANVIESPSAVPTLQTLAAGAEAMTTETIKKWGDHLHLLNAYGPTEGSIVSVANDQVAKQRHTGNIGHMLQSGKAWIVDPNNSHQLAPVGAVGELCIEGALLARGYLNNHQKTAESFVENPEFMKQFTSDRTTQTRIYRTGDLVHYASDGSIVYIGRKDNQVKLAGQRMELGEIEHHLQADPRVKDAVVLMPMSGPGKKRLAAVLSLKVSSMEDNNKPWHTVSSERSALSQMNEARDRLSDLLPSYMVPGTWVVVRTIPKLASSKLDRKQVNAWLERLPEDEYRRILDIESSSEPVVAATETTKILQEVWSKVLNLPLEKVKLNKSWLALGGDSITAMQLLARCRKEGITLSLNQVLRSKSIAHLAETVSSSGGAVHRGTEQTDTPFELSPVQKMYFQSMGNEKDSHFNQSFTLRLSRHADSAQVKQALDAIVKAHSMLRARFIKSPSGTWQQTILGESNGAYRFQSHKVSGMRDIPPLISRSQKTLHFQHGPVFAVDFFEPSAGDQIIFLVAHHLVIDMVSWRVILGDLEDALNSGRIDSIESPLSFQNWCESQIQHARKQAEDNTTGDPLPFAIQPADLSFWGMENEPNYYSDVERETFEVNEAMSEAALNNHKALRTDAVDIFLTAIVHSFSRVFINRATPTVFNEGHGREPWEGNNLDLSRTVGWFTAMYPIHVPIGEDEDDVVQTLRKVKDMRRKVPDNGRPYFAHRYLTEQGERQCADHMPMELLFNYLGKMQQLEASDSLFQSVDFKEHEEEMMSDMGEKTIRPALFELSASVVRDRIHFSFMYNSLMSNKKGIRRWVAECQRTLEEIAKRLARIHTPQPTLSDFPLLPLDSYNRLDKVIKTFPSAGIKSFEEVEDMYPSANMQEGMLLTQIRDPNAYLSFSIFEAKVKSGRVDVRQMQHAWTKVVQRHPALRTVFVDSVCKGGIFDQIVLKEVDTGLVTIFCEKEEEIMGKLQSTKYINLNGKKKLRLPHQLTIAHSRSGKVICKMEINHAVIDGGSHAVLVGDIEAAYENRLPEGSGPLYSDYIKYIRSHPSGAAVNWWKNQLNGVQPCYFPVADKSEAKAREGKALLMDFKRYGEIQQLAEKCNVTFSAIMLSAWGFVLRSYLGSTDVCYGYLTSGRNIPVDGIVEAVGTFINMLVSRVKLTSKSSVLDVLQQVQNDFIESLPHQHCSLAQIQNELGLAGKQLFNTAVSIQNHSTSSDGPTSNIELTEVEAFDPNEFAITVNIEAGRGDEGVLFTYWTDLVSEDEMKRASSTMAKILTLIANNSEGTIGQLDEALARPDFVLEPEVPQISPPVAPAPEFSALQSPVSAASQYPAEGMAAMPAMPDWGSLVRSIVNEVVPEVLNQMFEKNKLSAPNANVDPTSQMVGMITRKASQRLAGTQLRDFRSAVETASIRSRRMSVASDTESRIATAADMVAAAGIMATEYGKSVPPDFVEKKLLSIWSELLDMVEDSIGQDDSFFQLGGDSIIAMRLVGAAREEGLSMTVGDVFKNPTFSDMTRVVRVAGEVIDQVMSQAGDAASIRGSIRESIIERSNSQRKASSPPAPVKSAWKDFQDIMADHESAIDDSDRSPPIAKSDKEPEQMFKKWPGFAPGVDGPIGYPQETSSPPPPTEQQNTSRRVQQRPVAQYQKPVTQFHNTRPQRAGTVQTIHEDANTKPISLLGDPNVDSVISKVQVFKGGISDVLPVTDFQSLAITGTLLESRWMLNYFYLDGNGPLDLRKLKQSAFRLVQAYDILRTVFVPYGDRFLQVVLRKLQPDFIYQETDQDFDKFTEDLRQKDKTQGPRLGETFVQFIVAKQKKSEHHRIFMRISHAQYDGFCLPKILESLEGGYNGQPISSAPSFGNYVRESAKAAPGAHDYWRELLDGSKMTEIVHRYGPDYKRSAGQTITLKQTVTTPSLSHLNVTHASVVKAAWSSTLAHIASSADVVFGHVISGRNGAVPNVENIVGPCLNMVPVRVTFEPSWTVLDLLRYIQDQQINNMPFESLGFREITRNCTDWPDWTNFSSMVQHNQNIHEAGAVIHLGGTEYHISGVGSQEDFADFSVVSSFKGGDQLELSLTYAPNSTITPEFAQSIFDMLSTTVITFAADPYTLLPSPSELTSTEKKPIKEKLRKPSDEKAPIRLPTEAGVAEKDILSLSDKLRSAWEQILRDDQGNPIPLDLQSDFFDLGGDIMGLAQVSSMLDQEGLRVRVEDLIEKCVFVDQVGVLAVEYKKMMIREAESPWGDKKNKAEEERRRREEEQSKKKGGFLKSLGLGMPKVMRKKSNQNLRG